ncbi:MAG: HEAT repeat domain-containing protein, partial [Planctomycetales bacterium]|nr:HEAT repeat domain-containing protein [Planctomycetales bacterium]
MSPSCLFVLLLSVMPAADPYRDVVRTTEPLAPAEQRERFHLPPGFEIQLVAAEPDIQKPMNLAFDGAGRLWVSDSVEYPYQAKDRPGRDSIKVLADRDGDGRAEQITTFVDQLNIPIGLYPYRDGVVAYSIPNIWHFADTDGDGCADRREILYGPLGEPRDTHGMQNGFRRGFDGWLYVNHGFNNETTITARDGSSIQLHSGNSYRIRLDGSRVEQFTWGQVNPFGSTFLPDGDLVNADCHSKPLSLLLRGGYYPSFGKPDDGLGFVQPIMDHSHGSTAIAGAAVCTSPAWPAEYHGRLFVGNVMTCRVHMDRLDYTGSTMHAVEQPDFLVCDDPWFRPVDLRFGPDGALYIADFYNRIIGHYEVPLDHPQRDRHRGRIWRVVYVGEAGDANGGEAVPDLNLATAGVDALIEMLGDPNLTRRELAADQLSDRIGSSAVEALRKAAADASNAWRRIHAGWLLQRLGQLDETLLLAATRDRDWLVRTHAMRVAAERSDWSQPLREAAFDLLRDEHPRVRRAAADALGQHPHASAVAALLAALAKAPTDDAHLRQMIRIALRNQLRDSPAFPALEANAASADLDALADIAVAVPNEQAAGFLVSYLKKKRESAETRPANSDRTLRLLSHAARYLPADQVSSLVQLARETTVDNLDLQSSIISTVRESLARRGLEPNEDFRRWAADVAGQLL